MKRFLKRFLPLLLSLTAVFAIVGSTYAYLAATDNQIVNKFQLAQVDTSTHEETGDEFEKKVYFANDNVSAVYIRARVLVSGADAGVDGTAVNFVDIHSAGKPDGNAITVSYDSSAWEQKGDWFYYRQVLRGKTQTDTSSPTTAPLIYQVLVGDGVDTSKDFEVEVYEESVLTSAMTYVYENAAAAFGTA